MSMFELFNIFCGIFVILFFWGIVGLIAAVLYSLEYGTPKEFYKCIVFGPFVWIFEIKNRFF